MRRRTRAEGQIVAASASPHRLRDGELATVIETRSAGARKVASSAPAS
jgi:hypothetical protein